jgi:hypothetical protein|tara:strand:+ start:553 stop:972 length:420 start_codon:yes stop_codon:yes gene_type:complete
MAKGPDQKKVMHRNSLANLTPGTPKKVDAKLQASFQQDVFAMWSKIVDEETGQTAGQAMLAIEAMKNPGKMITLVANMMPKMPDPNIKKNNEVANFADALIKLNKAQGNAKPITKADAEVIDVEIFDEGTIPVSLDDKD